MTVVSRLCPIVRPVRPTPVDKTNRIIRSLKNYSTRRVTIQPIVFRFLLLAVVLLAQSWRSNCSRQKVKYNIIGTLVFILVTTGSSTIISSDLVYSQSAPSLLFSAACKLASIWCKIRSRNLDGSCSSASIVQYDYGSVYSESASAQVNSFLPWLPTKSFILFQS